MLRTFFNLVSNDVVISEFEFRDLKMPEHTLLQLFLRIVVMNKLTMCNNFGLVFNVVIRESSVIFPEQLLFL